MQQSDTGVLYVVKVYMLVFAVLMWQPFMELYKITIGSKLWMNVMFRTMLFGRHVGQADTQKI